jgi:hypothetical protein
LPGDGLTEISLSGILSLPWSLLSSRPPEVELPLPLRLDDAPVVSAGAALGFAELAAGSPVVEPRPLGAPPCAWASVRLPNIILEMISACFMGHLHRTLDPIMLRSIRSSPMTATALGRWVAQHSGSTDKKPPIRPKPRRAVAGSLRQPRAVVRPWCAPHISRDTHDRTTSPQAAFPLPPCMDGHDLGPALFQERNQRC